MLWCIDLLPGKDLETNNVTDVACTAVATQRIGKHVPAATNKHTTIEFLLETVFSALTV
jgi:hypothetical protein